MPDDPHPTDGPPPFLDFRAETAALPMGIQSLYAASAGLHHLNAALRAIAEAMSYDKAETIAAVEASPVLPQPAPSR